MWKYIDRLRQKPESYRRRFAFVSAAVITGAIFIIWLTTLPFTIGNMQREAEENARKTKEVSPVEAVKENLGTAFVGVKDQFEDLGDKLQESVTPPSTGTQVETQPESSGWISPHDFSSNSASGTVTHETNSDFN